MPCLSFVCVEFLIFPECFEILLRVMLHSRLGFGLVCHGFVCCWLGYFVIIIAVGC